MHAEENRVNDHEASVWIDVHVYLYVYMCVHACIYRKRTNSLDNETDAKPSWFVTFAPKVADEEHGYQHCHVECAGNEPGRCAGELVATLNSREDNRSKAYNMRKWFVIDERCIICTCTS